MKELSIEEKAKAYDEALKVAKSNYETIVQMDNDCTFVKEGIVNTFHHMFPELKESEDERIRRRIIHALHGDVLEMSEIKEAIAWLEKQGEHVKFRDSIQVGDKVTRNQDGVLVNLSQLKRVAKPSGDIDTEKQSEQKSAWSEEDKRNLDWLITVCERIHYKSDPQVSPKGALVLKDWLKSLKDRYLPQPKQEWSEEDESMLNNVIDTLVPLSQTTHSGYAIGSMINWLKSLRPQSQWKPSEEQINALAFAVVDSWSRSTHEALKELFEQLKAL